MQAMDGCFYGTTADTAFYNGGGASPVGYGTIFRLAPGGTLTTIYSFADVPGGVEPVAGLIQGSDNRLYGTTEGGGASTFGTIFRLTVPMPPIFDSIRKTNGGFILTCRTVAGLSYQLQFNGNGPGGNNWTNLGSPFTATNGIASIFDSSIPQQKRFYRLILLP